MFYMKVDQTGLDMPRILVCQDLSSIRAESKHKIKPGDIYVMNGPAELENKGLSSITINVLDFQTMVVCEKQNDQGDWQYDKKVPLNTFSKEEIRNRKSDDGKLKLKLLYDVKVCLNDDFSKAYNLQLKGYSYFYENSLGKVLNKKIVECMQESKVIHYYQFKVKVSNVIGKNKNKLYFFEVDKIQEMKNVPEQFINIIKDFYKFKLKEENLQIALDQLNTSLPSRKPVNVDDISDTNLLAKHFADGNISQEDFARRSKELASSNADKEFLEDL